MKTRFPSLALATLSSVLVLPVWAVDSYTVDPRHTKPVFEINHLGFSTQRGRFNAASGKIMIDREARTGSVDLTIDTASIDMGLDDWDKHMKSEDFFHVEKFPTMRFVSDKLVFDNGRVTGAEGSLTLLGVTKPVTLAVTHFECGLNPITKKATCGANIHARIMRSDFGMTKYVPAVGDEVTIIAPVEAIKE